MLKRRESALEQRRAIELRDGQIYRWSEQLKRPHTATATSENAA
jgi:hypothetical protein